MTRLLGFSSSWLLLIATFAIGLFLLVQFTPTALANEGPPSTCLAIAQNEPVQPPYLANPPVMKAAYQPAYSTLPEVKISFQGHSTYLIESPEGVRIATDYAGWMNDQRLPNVVTMNQAHSSHYTDFPNPKITHVFRGWGTNGDIARHHEQIGDVLVRNVTTDLLRWRAQADGNSIFIFETAGLCIGHLGHLHHELSDDHFAKVGRLDIVMVPVDGGLTLSHFSLTGLLKRLRASIVLPMHVRSADALPRFLAHVGDNFPVERLREKVLTVSLASLPKRPTVMLMPGVDYYPVYDE